MANIVPCQSPLHVPCDLAFLAEAPGEDEEDKGKPLVGPAGKVFNAGLRAAGIDRAKAWVGNVFDVKAPGNDVGPWIKNQGFHKPHLDRLRRELEEAQPTVIVPMGDTALWALTGQGNIMKRRGGVELATHLVPGVKIVPTVHPSYVQRQWEFLIVFVWDLLRAKREAKVGPGLVVPVRRFLICPTVEDVRRYVEGVLLKADMISLDIETGWGQITSVGLGPGAEEAMCIPFVDVRSSTKSYWGTVDEEVEVWRLIRRVCESPIPKIGQNVSSFDAFWLLDRMGIKVMGLTHDTRLMSHALFPQLPKDLATLAGSFGTQGQWKHWTKGGTEKRDD